MPAVPALYSYPKQKRLLKPLDFQHVFSKALKINGSSFVFFIQKNELASARLGLVITKRRFKNAVDRNRLRRLIRESFRLCANQLSSIDVIVLAKTMMPPPSNLDLQRELKQHWRKLVSIHSPKYACIQ